MDQSIRKLLRAKRDAIRTEAADIGYSDPGRIICRYRPHHITAKIMLDNLDADHSFEFQMIENDDCKLSVEDRAFKGFTYEILTVEPGSQTPFLDIDVLIVGPNLSDSIRLLMTTADLIKEWAKNSIEVSGEPPKSLSVIGPAPLK